MSAHGGAIPFSPAVYEHAARLIGRSPWEVARDGNLLLQAHAEAYRLYRHSPVVLGIDIYNLEAEAYGASVRMPRGNGIPAIAEPLCASVADILLLNTAALCGQGRIPLFIETGAEMRKLLPEADVRLPVSGPFSIAGNLCGIETLLTECLSDPVCVSAALFHLAEGQIRFARACVEAGLGVTVFESAATPPMIPPAIFREVELPPLKFMMEEIGRILGAPAPCVAGGDTVHIIDGLIATGTRYVICPGETDQPAFMQAMERYPDVTVRVNMRPEIVAGGEWDAVLAETERVCALAAGRMHSCVGTGVLPFETDPARVIAIADIVQGFAAIT